MTHPLRIMIVEDDSFTALTIEEILVKFGYIICGKAVDFDSAIKIMKNESPDLIIMDIDLDGQQPDGIMTAHELLRIKPVPIIYLTGVTEFETFQRAKKTNPVAYLYKPFRDDELAIQIDLALSNFYQGNITDIVSTSKCIYISEGQNKLVRVFHDGIYYIKAQRKYTDVFITKEEAQKLDKRKTFDINLPFTFPVGFGHLTSHLPNSFYKVSRSLAVNLDHLVLIDNGHFLIGPHEIPLKEGGRKLLLARINSVQKTNK